ncbi:Hypothetical protein FSTVST1_230 [Faustovirus ST1]|nr:Hypothetical protein FSTVST1_230 [Faustovirus ST1]
MQSYTNCGSIKPEHRDAKRKRGNNNNDDDIDDNKRFKSAIAKPLVIRELFPMGHPG